MGYGMKELKKYGFPTENKVFVVAEIGINHGGNIKTAKKLIDSASRAGVDAVKFQTYITEKRVPKDSPIFDILKRCELPFEAFNELKEYTEKYKMVFFSTPFDTESVDLLESIKCKIYKIASFDVTNYGFLRRIANTQKPIIMSVGMSTLDEIKAAYKILSSKTNNIAILHCISSYPTNKEDANLSAIYVLKDNFDCIIGHSDHTDGIKIPLYAVAAGAQIIEKHYKINSTMDCVDSPVSITESMMKKLVQEIRFMEKIIGDPLFGVRVSEKQSECFRRASQ